MNEAEMDKGEKGRLVYLLFSPFIFSQKISNFKL
ncbi:hypothetical protein PMI13_00590 [Chryseobacterium populi]|uniref:Uncharacterized protein n=1 Tax=Chryseobacterium populi TaxID=1144316 RepID=J2KPY4_9FLAO|nr:hypothetical protein PMI13_00590 [Chryseobacterium populi]